MAFLSSVSLLLWWRDGHVWDIIGNGSRLHEMLLFQFFTAEFLKGHGEASILSSEVQTFD